MSEVDFRWVGRMTYSDALSLQYELVDQRRSGEIPDTVLLLEHEPVYTIGRTRDRSSLQSGEGEAPNLPHPVVITNRGGLATYHGPGQLTGYLILDLQDYGSDLHTFLRSVEEMLILYLRSLGLESDRREGLTGAWIGPRKIASIGIGVKRWISMHGFALNVDRDISGFDSIVPCGIDQVEMTSLNRELGSEKATPETVAGELIPFMEAELKRISTA